MAQIFITKTMKTKQPQIYVACLAAYNHSILHGEWLEADQDPENLQEKIDRILATSPALKFGEYCEEWAIHDYDDMPNLGEYVSLQEVSDLAKAIAECGEAYEAYIDHVGSEFANLENFRELYCGEWESEKDFVMEHFPEENEIPAHLKMYIDYESIATDWFIGDYYMNNSHVFRR